MSRHGGTLEVELVMLATITLYSVDISTDLINGTLCKCKSTI